MIPHIVRKHIEAQRRADTRDAVLVGFATILVVLVAGLLIGPQSAM